MKQKVNDMVSNHLRWESDGKDLESAGQRRIQNVQVRLSMDSVQSMHNTEVLQVHLQPHFHKLESSREPQGSMWVWLFRNVLELKR